MRLCGCSEVKPAAGMSVGTSTDDNHVSDLGYCKQNKRLHLQIELHLHGKQLTYMSSLKVDVNH